MRIVEVVRRALLELGHLCDEDMAGYMLDAFGIRVHPRLVAAVRRSLRDQDKVSRAERRRRKVPAGAP